MPMPHPHDRVEEGGPGAKRHFDPRSLSPQDRRERVVAILAYAWRRVVEEKELARRSKPPTEKGLASSGNSL